MATYNINRGVDKPAEFKGLKSQYLFIFFGGLIAEFILFVILYLMGISTWICIAFALISSLILLYSVFKLNGKYGQYGLMKVLAKKQHPRFIINRKTIKNLL